MPIFENSSDRFAEQDALARLSYGEDWSAFLALAAGDEIATSVWSADKAGLILDGAASVDGVTTIWASEGTPGTIYRVANQIETVQGRRDVRYFNLSVTDGAQPAAPLVTALFNRFKSVADFKGSSAAFSSGTFPVGALSDDDIWLNLVQAEAELAHELRVNLAPMTIVPEQAPSFEIDALEAAGTPYRKEAAYDYDPATWTRDAWGFIALKNKPVVRLDSVRFAYPGPDNTVLDVPPDWCRLDHKYGHLQIVPTGTLMQFGPLYTYMMTAISSGRLIPGMVQIRYVAGINAARDYPDLIGLAQRMAMLRLIKGAYMPQSGSVSGDGLSQSSSIDSAKWQDEIDAEIGRLRDTIHGIRFGVL